MILKILLIPFLHGCNLHNINIIFIIKYYCLYFPIVSQLSTRYILIFQTAQSKSQKKRQRKKQNKPDRKSQSEDTKTESNQQNTVITTEEAPSEIQKGFINPEETPASLSENLPRQPLKENSPERPAPDLSHQLKPAGDEICKVEPTKEKPSVVKMEDADQSREAIKAARQAKKAAKKNKEDKKDKPKPAAASEPKNQVPPPVKTAPASVGKENKATPEQPQKISKENTPSLEPSQKSNKEKEYKAHLEQAQKTSKELKEERRQKQVLKISFKAKQFL